ncbi:hypothetical protein [Phreatobacter stygius]
MALIGDLNFSWTNNESLFIYVLRLLLGTDDMSAAIVFSTLNTTRARLDLVTRLAKAHVTDVRLRREISRIVATFSKLTHLRNELTHCIFVVDEHGAITDTQTMKIEESRRRMRFGVRHPFDDARIQELTAAIGELNGLNRKIWDLLPQLEAHRNGPAGRPAGDAGASTGS